MGGRFWVSVALPALLAGASGATPPQTVSVDDVLFAATDSHLYLLRSLEDNMGKYGIVQTDVLLIARNRATNTDDEVWPVARSTDYGAYFADNGIDARVERLPLEGAVNPFEMVASRDARLMVGRSVDGPLPEGISVSDQDGGVTLTEPEASGGKVYRLGFEDLSRDLTESLARTRDTLPPLFAEGGVDVLRGVTFDPAVDCRIGGFRNLADIAGQSDWLVTITCENDQTMAPVTTVLALTPEG
jgi:hypothetical protein